MIISSVSLLRIVEIFYSNISLMYFLIFGTFNSDIMCYTTSDKLKLFLSVCKGKLASLIQMVTYGRASSPIYLWPR